MVQQSNHLPGKYCMVGFFNFKGDARVRGYAKWLVKRGDTVDVICAHNSNTNAVIETDGVRVLNIATEFSKNNRLAYLQKYTVAFLKIFSILVKQSFIERYRVIHFHNIPDFLIFTGFISRLLGSKLILDIHDPMPEAYQSKFPDRKEGIEIRLVRFEERISCRYADAVITANQHFKDNLVSRGIPANKITVIKNYPDTDIFNKAKRVPKLPTGNKNFVLIFPGTIAPRYGLHVAVKAMPSILERVPNARLQIIGFMGEYSSYLQNLANEMAVAEHVEIIPSVPNDIIPDYLLNADIGIYPALPDPHMSIAIPGKLLEFVIMGLPIISSRLPIVEEMFDDDAILYFKPGSHEEFAQKVIKLHQDSKLRSSMIQCADRNLETRFSLEREIQTYFGLLNGLKR